MSAAADFSVVTLPTLHGEAMIVRLHAPATPPRRLDALGLGADVNERIGTLLAQGHGAVIVTGPAGSGITSTLHALLIGAIAPGRLLLSVEDPIERELEGITQVLVGPDLPVVTTLRRALAARPDVVLIGDLRDGASAAVAIDAALSGRLLFAGLTGRDAASTPGRLLSMGLEPVLLAGALSGIVAQRLVRTLCANCSATSQPSDEELEAIGWQEGDQRTPALRRAVGCDRCHQIGYAGVAVIAEVLTMTDDLARLITMRTNASDIQKLAIAQGMRPLRDAGLALVRDGVTSITELARVL
jgi:type II secretory ATPase GspE/PulE/Tfp pilus assembly ATPase PilB-like protein